MLGGWWHLSLAVALPFPAYWRMKYELEAYQISATLVVWSMGDIGESHLKHITQNFTGPLYYYMWPFKGYIDKRLLAAVERAKNWDPTVDKDPYLNAIMMSMRGSGKLHE